MPSSQEENLILRLYHLLFFCKASPLTQHNLSNEELIAWISSIEKKIIGGGGMIAQGIGVGGGGMGTVSSYQMLPSLTDNLKDNLKPVLPYSKSLIRQQSLNRSNLFEFLNEESEKPEKVTFPGNQLGF